MKKKKVKKKKIKIYQLDFYEKKIFIGEVKK